jgi:hypothetical protein
MDGRAGRTGTNCYRQCHHPQISAAKGISASAYLSLNAPLAVLCRKTLMPMSPPGQPPMAPSNTKVRSATRDPERPARHLSKPNARKVTVLITANQPAAHESRLLKRQGYYHLA